MKRFPLIRPKPLQVPTLISSHSRPPRFEAEAGASDTSSSGISSNSEHPSFEVTKSPEASQRAENVDLSSMGPLDPSSLLPDDKGVKEPPIVSRSVAPHAGKAATKNRNQRRRVSTKFKLLKSRGLLSPNATMADYHRMQAGRVKTKEPSDKQGEKPKEEAGAGQAAFDANLLKTVPSGGIEVTHNGQRKSHSNLAMGDTSMEKSMGGTAGIPDGPQPQSQIDQTRASGATPDLSGRNANLPNSATADLIDRIKHFVEKVENQSGGVNAVADRPSTPNQVAVPSNAVITPNETGSPPDEVSPPLIETAAKTDAATPPTTGSSKRARLDISSTKRLVFGSLGVRVPRTKEDEANVSAKLIKDIRSLQVFKPKETSEASQPSITRTTEDESNWKEKIVLMAVECCQDGIELSTPPFPFVQRWDPQQQKHRGENNPHRGNKRKRDDDQYYQERPGLGVSEDLSNRGAPASFATEALADGESMEPQLEQQEQNAPQAESDENANQFGEKIQRELGSSVPILPDNEDISDLPCLPEDVSTCLSLSAAMINPGTIVAFKQLDMSALTNWQPKISDYRTARVDCLTDDGVLKMKLAKRDQLNKEEVYDQQTGERVYSKFEMPGFDDEDAENPGVIEISFSELIEPKLIQVAKFQSANQQSSVHNDNHAPLNVGTAMENEIQPSPAGAKTIEPELPNARSSQGRMTESSEGVRQEIFDLIKEAGWRSSVRASNEDDHRSESNPALSPNGPLPQNQSAPRDEIYRGGDNSSPRVSLHPNGFTSSPPGEKSLETPNQPDQPEQQAFEGFQSDSLHSQDGFEIPETVPAHLNTVPNTPIKTPFGNGAEAADIKEEDYEAGDLWSEPRYQPEAVHQVPSPELASQNPRLGSIDRPVQLAVQSSKGVSSPAPASSLHEFSSDNEFPTLENVLSQVRSSQAVSCQARPSFEARVSDDDLTYMDKSSLESTATRRKDLQTRVVQSSESSGEDNISQKRTLFKWEDSDEGDQTTPRASQKPAQPQIVDLTIPSDPTDATGDSDYVDDGTQLPAGPGWVKKARATSGRLRSVKTAEGRSMKYRSRSVY